MRSVIKYLFFTYVIFLAGYVTYGNLLKRSFGRQRAEFNQPEKKCAEGGSGWDYCVFVGSNTDTSSILYFFHGKGETAESWLDATTYAGLLQSYWQSKSKKIPVVVSISFGDSWLVTNQMSKSSTGIMERIQGEVFPVIEKKLGRPRNRFLLGHSIGALNVLTVALTMNQHFSRVAALCPPLTTMSPYDNWKKVLGFMTRTGARPKNVFTMLGLGRYYFANTNEWLQFSPLERIRSTQFKPHQRFYISAGIKDEFGLYEGTQAFVNSLRRTGAITYWHPNSGGHCAVDIESLGDFLSL